MVKTIYPEDMETNVVYIDSREKERTDELFRLFKDYNLEDYYLKSSSKPIIIEDVKKVTLISGDYAYKRLVNNLDENCTSTCTIGVEYKNAETGDAYDSFRDGRFQNQLRDGVKNYDYFYGIIQGVFNHVQDGYETPFATSNIYPKLAAKGYHVFHIDNSTAYKRIICNPYETLFKNLETLFWTSSNPDLHRQKDKNPINNVLFSFPSCTKKASDEIPKNFFDRTGEVLTGFTLNQLTYDDIIKCKGMGKTKTNRLLAELKGFNIT